MVAKLSLAIPSSSISSGSCRSQNQASHIAHQIGRIAMHYGVDEIVVYDDTRSQLIEEPVTAATQKKIVFGDDDEDQENKHKKNVDDTSPEALMLAKLLQFYITPSYLRHISFGDLGPFQYAKKLPKLPRLPFLNHKSSRYMEGLTVPGKVSGTKKYKKGQQKSKKQLALESMTKYVNIGGSQLVELAKSVPVNSRVTVDTQSKKVVSPSEAYDSKYFGYAVRIAKEFGKVFTETVSADGYSFTAFVPCGNFVERTKTSKDKEGSEKPADLLPVSEQKLRSVGNGTVLLVFGVFAQINQAVKDDKTVLEQVDDGTAVFDGKISVGSENLRIEDAVTISMAKIEGL